MQLKLLAKRLTVALLLFGLPFIVTAQNKTVTGKVTSEKDGTPISGASVIAKGSSKGTKTATDGTYSLDVPAATKKLLISSVGNASEEVSIGGDNTASVVLKGNNEGLTEVVVIGYGTARKKDLTGAVSSVSAKNFNKGPTSSADQLIQGKVAGVQVLSNNGAPGGGTTVRVRGASSLRAGNGPLYIIDGVPLSNTNSRPDIALTSDIGGNSPAGNPLNFINSNDIASMEVLKDASAAAIYGSRAANGVVLITTKRAQSGTAKVDFSFSVGTSKIAKKLEVLTGDEYRAAASKFGVGIFDGGKNTDALGSILRNGSAQNYSVGVSAGTESARYRFSLGYLDQQGIIKKTDFKKYTANFSSNFRMLENKKLNIDFNVIASQTAENIAPISNTGGAKGSLIGQALKWNPTVSLTKSGSDSLNILYGSDNINPLAYSEAYNDKVKVTTILASVAPSYKITEHLEAKTQLSINYSSGLRKQYTSAFVNINDIAYVDEVRGRVGGDANVAQNELVTKQITNTLAYNNNISKNIYLNAVIGHEYITTDFGGNSQSARKFLTNTDKPYYYYFATSEVGTRQTNGFQDPKVELQSFFGRTIFNISDKYLITGTIRADGSSKFGKNNKYGVFPSIAAGWNVSKENFMSGINAVSNIKLRASYGITGNQEFAAGLGQITYRLNTSNPASFTINNYANPDLTWEQTATSNVGLEFSLLNKKLNFVFDYFNRKTTKILYARDAGDPIPPAAGTKWENLQDAKLLNNGFEAAVNAQLYDKNNLSISLGVNVTLLKNKLTDFTPVIETGVINGPGLSSPASQLIKEGYPINSYYLQNYLGIDKTTGLSNYANGGIKEFFGSPNPTSLVGLSLNVAYKQFSLEANMNGAFGHFIYNNSANAYLNFNKIRASNNVSKREYDIAVRDGESPSNPTAASSRYLEKGDYIRMANMTFNYSLGKIGKNIKSSNIFITAQNLFIITKFSGFDPEVNVDKSSNGIPSFGIEYTPYPSARTINFGFNLSL